MGNLRRLTPFYFFFFHLTLYSYIKACPIVSHVGTQDISPLIRSIPPGAFFSSETMFKDILTIRADRDLYHFGTDGPFHRLPDIVLVH